jgi:hypothetical protein
MFEEKFENGTPITPFLACAYAEGFCEGENASAKDQLRAWAYLIKTGQCWSLQGFYGRSVSRLIESGIISSEGIINWDKVEIEINPQLN